MSKQVTGILKTPGGEILASQSLSLVAIRSTPPGIIKGSTVSFSTDGAGLYDVTVENGYFRVTAESESGGDIALGSIYIDGGAPSDLPTLLSINEQPDAPVNDALQALADAAAASALAAEQSAIAAQASADSINPADYVPSTEKGAANGVATLEGDGKVPASQLPSYVDDVLEYPDFASLPAVGESGKIYITLDDNKSWRWASTVYVEISSSMSGAEIKALYEAEPNTNAFTDAEESKLAGIEANATTDQTGAEIKSAYEAEPDTNAFTDADKASVESFPALAVNTVAAAMGFTAHGLMREPNLDSDYTCPATTPNQFTVNVRQDRIGGTIVDIPSTNVTLPAAPSTSALLSRRDVVYLRENGAIEVFEGLDDNSDMATAGFSAVSGEDGLWSDGTGLATPLAYVNRRNQGVYHPYFNENGCGEFSDNLPWYSTTDTVLSVSDCFASPSGGAIGGVSGRSDDLFYDAIYLSDITIPSLQATAPSPTQLEPDYWRDKLAANTFKGFRNEGIPFLVPIERGVVEGLSTSTGTVIQISVGSSANYAVGDFVIVVNQNSQRVASGYVSSVTAVPGVTLTTTPTNALTSTQTETVTRTNGDTYTILKVEYREAKTSDLTWTDIIGDPANYPRQATGVIDWDSSEGSVPLEIGQAVHVDSLTTGSGTIGNVYLRLTPGATTNLEARDYTVTTTWLDLGTKAEFLSNAQGMAGFPLIYGESGEDLIPDGTSKTWKMRRKCAESFGRVQSEDRGVSYIYNDSWDADFEGSSNGTKRGVQAALIILLTYKTSALPLEDDVLGPALGSKLGSVWAGKSSDDPSLFISNLIGKVPVGTANPYDNRYGEVIGHRFSSTTAVINPDALNAPQHSPAALSAANPESPATKVLPYLTQDKQPKLQVIFKEMIYDTTWGDNNKFTVVSNTATDTDDNANTILVGTKSVSPPIVLSGK